MDDSNPRADQDAPPWAIFLSHSGKQKPFVESLNNALRDANHTPFFDRHSIPRGTAFPSEIEKAACGCKLGVVVLSDDFLTSRWSMLELEMLVLKRGPNASVLPLFYKLSPDDLKSRENLLKWKKIWKEKDPERAEQWERAVKAIGYIVGELFNSKESESAYIKRVVQAICKLLPSPVLYDLSHVKGKDRLEKEVRRHFEEVARQCNTVRMVGLHAVGGSGKTTMCKIMGNHYNSQYLGKFYHIEFPNDNDEKKIVQECKKALKTLVNLNDEHVLKRADDFDQVVQLMKENLGRYDVFLAIDNVWESSREKAERLLGVGFSANSKILLTSRSAQVLKDLLSRHMNTHLGPLPSPDNKEALQIFQETISHGDLKSVVMNRNHVVSVLQRCFFSGSYHAQALKALSQHVKRACELQGSHSLSRILAEISNRDLQTVGDLIKLNYSNLPEHKQHLFLDIVVVMMKVASISSCEEANRWLSILYKQQYSESTISNLIYDLASDGLIQLEEDGECGKMITVHDLYSDLAKTEAASSSRFFIVDGPFITRSPVEEIEWEKLERVILTSGCRADFVDKLQQAKCHKLQVLYAVSIDFKSRIDMDLMPSLCVLKLQGGHLRSIKNWSAATRLEIYHLIHLWGLTCLEWLELTHNASSRALKEVHIERCSFLKKVPDLSGLTCLERLELIDNDWMKEMGGLSRALKQVRIVRCGALKKVPDLSGLTRLERLELFDNPSMEGVGGLISGALKVLCIAWCGALQKVPDLRGLTCLETLELIRNGSMEEVGGLISGALKVLHIAGCGALQKVPDLSGLTRLERLALIDNPSMEGVGGLISGALKEVRIVGCGALQKVPDLSGLTRLERLELIDNPSMKKVGGLISGALKVLRIVGCGALQKVPDLRGLTCLETLELFRNGSMEEVVGGLSRALKEVCIFRCGALQKVPDLRGLTCLETLELMGNGSMEEVVGGLISGALKVLRIEGCGALQKVPDLRGLTRLETLELIDNPSMEEVVGGLSRALKEVRIQGCGALQKVPDLRGLTCLERLELTGNGSTEDVRCALGGNNSELLKYLTHECGGSDVERVPIKRLKLDVMAEK